MVGQQQVRAAAAAALGATAVLLAGLQPVAGTAFVRLEQELETYWLQLVPQRVWL